MECKIEFSYLFYYFYILIAFHYETQDNVRGVPRGVPHPVTDQTETLLELIFLRVFSLKRSKAETAERQPMREIYALVKRLEFSTYLKKEEEEK